MGVIIDLIECLLSSYTMCVTCLGETEQVTSGDFTFSSKQFNVKQSLVTCNCRVFVVSDNHLDQHFKFVKDMLLQDITTASHC